MAKLAVRSWKAVRKDAARLASAPPRLFVSLAKSAVAADVQQAFVAEKELAVRDRAVLT
jgi:hypothetical protein